MRLGSGRGLDECFSCLSAQGTSSIVIVPFLDSSSRGAALDFLAMEISGSESFA